MSRRLKSSLSLLLVLWLIFNRASGVITVFFLGTVFALVYLWRQSLVTPIMMHFLQDFTGIVLAPWLGLR